MKNTIVPTTTPMGENESNLLDQGSKLSFAQKQAMQCLCGAHLSTAAENAALTAPFSVMKARTKAPNSYAKRMQLLIASGLVAGITPTSVRKGLNQLTLDFALSKQDGDD